ncbi:MAG TPA: RNA polymerase sigma factor [Thermoleophilaceae bacterium]|jgi:RNA polymerase sigma factor (sigma-70 family)
MEVSSLPRPGGGIQPRSPRLLAAFGDERLVEQLRRGNDAAFEAMYDRHHRGILSFCRHMLRSREEAEDAVQQTFISAYRDISGSDKEIRLKPWLYTIARNRCLSILRARHEQPAEIDDVPTAGFSEEVAQRDDLRRLLADMRELPVDQRAALVLSELGDLSHAEIAQIVGCPPMKVKSLVFQARSSLIESREAREIPCEQIREQLATLTGGALRRGPLRRHLKSCPACADFREQVKRQRQMVACLLPIAPTVGLKGGILAAAGVGPGAAGGLAAGGAAAGGTAGGIGAGIGAGSIAKLAVAALVAAGVVGGGLVVRNGIDPADGDTPVSPRGGVATSPDGSRIRLESLTSGAAAGVLAGRDAEKDSLATDARPGGDRASAHRDGTVRGGHKRRHRHGPSTPGSTAPGNATPDGGGRGHGRRHGDRGRHRALGHEHAPGWNRHQSTAPAAPAPPPPPPPEDEADKGKKHTERDGHGGPPRVRLPPL